MILILVPILVVVAAYLAIIVVQLDWTNAGPVIVAVIAIVIFLNWLAGNPRLVGSARRVWPASQRAGLVVTGVLTAVLGAVMIETGLRDASSGVALGPYVAAAGLLTFGAGIMAGLRLKRELVTYVIGGVLTASAAVLSTLLDVNQPETYANLQVPGLLAGCLFALRVFREGYRDLEWFEREAARPTSAVTRQTDASSARSVNTPRDEPRQTHASPARSITSQQGDIGGTSARGEGAAAPPSRIRSWWESLWEILLLLALAGVVLEVFVSLVLRVVDWLGSIVKP